MCTLFVKLVCKTIIEKQTLFSLILGWLRMVSFQQTANMQQQPALRGEYCVPRILQRELEVILLDLGIYSKTRWGCQWALIRPQATVSFTASVEVKDMFTMELNLIVLLERGVVKILGWHTINIILNFATNLSWSKEWYFKIFTWTLIIIRNFFNKDF